MNYPFKRQSNPERLVKVISNLVPGKAFFIYIYLSTAWQRTDILLLGKKDLILTLGYNAMLEKLKAIALRC